MNNYFVATGEPETLLVSELSMLPAVLSARVLDDFPVVEVSFIEGIDPSNYFKSIDAVYAKTIKEFRDIYYGKPEDDNDNRLKIVVDEPADHVSTKENWVVLHLSQYQFDELFFKMQELFESHAMGPGPEVRLDFPCLDVQVKSIE